LILFGGSVLAQPPIFLKILGDDLRWNLVKALADSDRKVQELAQMLGEPQNLISYHLKRLDEYQLVHERHSSADGRVIYYSLDLDRVRRLFLASGRALHPSLAPGSPGVSGSGSLSRLRVLFLCTHNSARSQMAEGILRWRSQEQVEAFSAGTEPGQVHPLAVQVMAEMGVDIQSQRSKPLAEFLDQAFDYVITVCDRARENCPVFPGAPHLIHWSIPDPVALEGSERERYAAFKEIAFQLDCRVGYLLGAITESEVPPQRKESSWVK
jgi:protein-tyrosine-phosphatase/DNA-binding transcriptional ArsR family regulator